MENLKEGSWFICTAARDSFKNWDICKEISAWGIISGGRTLNLNSVKKGDYLVVFAASRGFISVAEVTGPMKCPETREEVPWAGGMYRYGKRKGYQQEDHQAHKLENKDLDSQ